MSIKLQKYILLILLIMTLASQAFAEVQVDYTNQFFASKTPFGQCYVFIYDDNITFVNGSGRKFEKIKLLYNTMGLNETFITGNVFCLKRRESLYCYDLAKLLKPENDSRRLDDCRAQTEQINGISALSIYNNTVYYTKVDNSSVYMYSPAENIKKDTPVPNNIQVTSKQYLKYVLYNPINERRQTEYSDKKTKIEGIIKNYNNIEAVESGRIEEKITPIGRNMRNQNSLNSQVKIYLDSKYGYDSTLFKDFFILARLTNKTSEADNVINTINRTGSDLLSKDINDFYDADSKLSGLRAPGLLEARQKVIKDEIAGVENDMAASWGRDYKRKNIDFSDFEKVYTTNEYKWIKNSTNPEIEFNANNNKITKFHNKLNGLLKDAPKYNTAPDYIEYNEIDEFYRSISRDYDTVKKSGYTNQNVAKSIGSAGELLNGLQIKLFTESYKQFKTKYDNITSLNISLANIKPKLDDEIRKAEESKNTVLKKVVGATAFAYRKGIHARINNEKPPALNSAEYNPSYIDYCIISDNDKRINGFKITDNIVMSDFGYNKNDAGDDYRFVRPSGYPLISVVKTAVFVLTSKKTISAFDLSRPNIIEKRISPLTIDEGVFYMVNSDGSQYQYVVTNGGQLLRLSLSGQTIIREPVGRVKGSDTVLVTGDDYYVFSLDGTVNKNNRASETIRVKSSNSGDIFTLVLRNKYYIIQ